MGEPFSKPTEERVCVWCGKTFMPNAWAQNYCSQECYRERRREYDRAYRQKPEVRARKKLATLKWREMTLKGKTQEEFEAEQQNKPRKLTRAERDKRQEEAFRDGVYYGRVREKRLADKYSKVDVQAFMESIGR